MRARILKFIWNYHLILLGAVGIVICICVPKVSDLLAEHLPEPVKVICSPITWILGGIMFGLICVFGIRRLVYRVKTSGRSYGKDYRRYKRGYSELIDYYTDADPYQMDADRLPEISWKETEGVMLGKYGKKIVKRDSEGAGNLATFGLPGCGKTTGQIIPTALQFAGSVLAIDIKGDILNFTKDKRKIKVFNPEEPESSCHFNPIEGLAESPVHERKLFLERISFILVQDESDSAGKYFVEGGRNFFCGISLYLLHQKAQITFPEIVSEILHGNAIEWVEKIIDGDCGEAQEYLASYWGSNEKNVAGCYNAISKALLPFGSGPLETLLNGRGEVISVNTLEEGHDVYIEIPQDKIKVYAPVTTLIVQNFMTGFMRRPDASRGEKLRPIIFLLDEFPQLRFEFDTLSAGLSTLRSKGVTLFLAQQSIAQIEKRYGEAGCREIIDTCAYISILSAQDPKSREFFQKLIGTRKVLRISNSENRKDVSRSINESRESIFQPEDFGNLDEKLIIYANGRYIKAEKIKCYE